MAEVLSATGLAKAYKGRRVVDGMSMSVNAGEIVGLLGPNGAGKTTCFYLMVGLVTSDEGAITLSGDDVTRLPIHLRARRGLRGPPGLPGKSGPDPVIPPSWWRATSGRNFGIPAAMRARAAAPESRP